MELSDLKCAMCGRCCRKYTVQVPKEHPHFLTFLKSFDYEFSNIPITPDRVEFVIYGMCKHQDLNSGLCKIEGQKRAKLCNEYHCWESPAFIGEADKVNKFIEYNARKLAHDMKDEKEIAENKKKIIEMLLERDKKLIESLQKKEEVNV